MESLLVRRLCYAYLRQLKISGQSWRQLSTVSSRLNISRRSFHQSTRRSFHQSTCFRLSQEPSGDNSKSNVSDKPSDMSTRDTLKQLDAKRQQNKKSSKGPGMVVLGICVAGFATLYFFNRKMMHDYEIAELTKSVNTGGEVLIGGEWSLTNQHGKTMTDKDFLGDWCIIYFGFTHCPDICPDEIEKIVEVTDILERDPSLPKVRALFITVDPERDSPEAVKNYLEEFSEKLIGLTGTKEDLAKVYRGFKVYYSIGPKDEDGDYIVDHSIIAYLMNPDGKYEAHFPRSRTNVEVANAIEKKMNSWKSRR